MLRSPPIIPGAEWVECDRVGPLWTDEVAGLAPAFAPECVNPPETLVF